MSSSCKGSDETVFGGRGGTGIVADIEVGVCRFSVDGCGFVGAYEECPCKEEIHHVKGILWCIVGRQLGS